MAAQDYFFKFWVNLNGLIFNCWGTVDCLKLQVKVETVLKTHQHSLAWMGRRLVYENSKIFQKKVRPRKGTDLLSNCKCGASKFYKQCKNVVRSQKSPILKKPHILTLPSKVHNVTIYKKYKSTMYIKFTYPCYSIILIQIILKCQSLWINLIEKNHFRLLTSTLIAVGGRICKFPIKGFMCFVSLFVYLSQRYWKSITFICFVLSIMKMYTFIRWTEFLMTNFFNTGLDVDRFC